MVVETLLTFLQFCCQSVVLLDLDRRCKQRRAEDAAEFLMVNGPPLQTMGRIQAFLGQGCFGKVFELQRHGQIVAAKIPRDDGPMPGENQRILLEECQRASHLRTLPRYFSSHPHIVQTFGAVGCATLWQLVQGASWPVALRSLPAISRCKVAEQLYSAAEYLLRMGHAMWDLHEADIVVEGSRSPHLTILDIFMEPSPILGLLMDGYWTRMIFDLLDACYHFGQILTTF
eukprot:s106_g22.t1